MPREDADEFRDGDASPCPVCDPNRARFQTIIWTGQVNPKPRRAVFRQIVQRCLSVLTWEIPHTGPTRSAPAPRVC